MLVKSSWSQSVDLLIREGPLEITGCGVTIPKKKKKKFLSKKIVQAVIPKNSKSYALEKKFLQTSRLF